MQVCYISKTLCTLDSLGFEHRVRKQMSLLHTRSDRSCDPTNLLCNGYRDASQGVKRPVYGV